MKIEVRYMSRGGNTKMLADEIANTANVLSVSIDDPMNGKLKYETDILFIGGGLYFYGMDKSLKKYIEELDPKRVHKIVPFSTSWKSKHTIELIREMAKAKGIETTEEYIYATNTPDEDELKEARRLTDIIINNY